ncbi:MAG: ORC1-type DNA replication protein [Candidatus Hodarchaeota archaeon]
MVYGESLDETFEKFLSGRVFKNRDVMRPTFVPKELPHREEQITRVGVILASALKNGTPSNIFIYGKTGTGKTAVTKYVLEHLSDKSLKLGVPAPIHAYINCRMVDTNYRVMTILADIVGANIPSTGLSTYTVFSEFRTNLDSKKQLMIIVLDEVDILVKKSGTDILYGLTRINTQLKKASVSIVGITNDLKFKDYLDSRVLSSLSEEEMVFPPYSALELQDILSQRAEMGFYDDVTEFGVINLCSALAAREHGDARRALDLLRVAGELAEREGAKKVTENYVRRGLQEIDRDTILEALSTLPIQQKLVLYSVYILEKHGYSEIITRNVFKVYSDLSQLLHMDSLTQRRVNDLINELDTLGIVGVKVISRGRYGRTKRISLSITNTQVKKSLEKDYRIKKCIAYIPNLPHE